MYMYRHHFKGNVVCLTIMLLLACSRCGADRTALIIGIDKYQDSLRISTLGGAAADAKAIAAVLLGSAHFDRVVLLAGNGKERPDRSSILYQVGEVKKTLKAGDTLLVYYAGHGFQKEDALYLLPQDVDGRNPEVLLGSAIPAADIVQAFRQIPLDYLITIYDMCRTDPIKNGRSIMSQNSLGENVARSLVVPSSASESGPRNTVTIVACGPGQRSYEWVSKGRGFFSYYLEQGLKQHAADENGVVRLKDLLEYLDRSVPAAVERELGGTREGLQRPWVQVSGSNPTGLVLVSGLAAAKQRDQSRPLPSDTSSDAGYRAQFDRAWELYAMKRYDAAKDRAEEAARLRPGASAAEFLLGRICYELGQYEEARGHYSNTIRLEPNSPGAYQNRGVALLRMDNPTQAKADFLKAIELDSSNSAAYSNLGSLLWDEGDAAGAEAELRKALTADSNYPHAHVNIGNIRYDEGNYPAAREHYSKAIEIDPTLAVAYDNLGNTAMSEEGNFVKAEELYHKAIALDPKLSNAYNDLGVLMRKKQNFAEAIQYFHKAVDANPSGRFACSNLGEAWFALTGDVATAKAYYLKAIKANPRADKAYYELGMFAGTKDNDHAAAERMLRKCVEIAPRNGLYRAVLAAALFHLNRREDALVEAQNAIKLGMKIHPVFEVLGIRP